MAEKDTSIIWWIIGIILLLAWFSGGDSSSDYYDGCYDADPTQWTDMVCE